MENGAENRNNASRRYAEKVGKHAVEFYEFAKTYQAAYYLFVGKFYEKVYVIPEEKK